MDEPTKEELIAGEVHEAQAAFNAAVLKAAEAGLEVHGYLSTETLHRFQPIHGADLRNLTGPQLRVRCFKTQEIAAVVVDYEAAFHG